MKIKISYLISAADISKKCSDPNYLKIFLTNEHEVPHICLDKTDKDETDLLKELHSKYLKCDFSFYPINLSGFRFLDGETCEVCYNVAIRYFSNVATNGRWYTLEEIQNNNILLEEYYGELYFRTRGFI